MLSIVPIAFHGLSSKVSVPLKQEAEDTEGTNVIELTVDRLRSVFHLPLPHAAGKMDDL